MLSPGTFSAQSHSTSELLRTLLMMAASEPTSWLFMHLHILLHLAYILGPYLAVWTVFLLTMNFLAHKSDCWSCFVTFGVWLISVSRGGTINYSVLYLHKTLWSTLALKLFRGEPAISQLDWNFTPSHKSSRPFSTGYSSVLHEILLPLQPAHG